MGPDVVPEMLDLLAAQVASPVQFVQGLRTLYDEGARVFVEVGPKKALQGFAADVLGDDVVALATNHPKLGDATAFNQALCGLYAAGLGVGEVDWRRCPPTPVAETARPLPRRRTASTTPRRPPSRSSSPAPPSACPGRRTCSTTPTSPASCTASRGSTSSRRGSATRCSTSTSPAWSRAKPAARFETIDSPADVIKLAGRAGEFDLGEEFGVDAERIPALGRETQLAIGAGHRRPARRRHPARPALPDDERRQPAARPVDAPRRPARQHRRHLRLGVPRLQRPRRRADPVRDRHRPPRSSSPPWKRCGPRSPPPTATERRWPRSTGASTTCSSPSSRTATRSTAASCSACCRWGTRSSPS